MRNDEEAPIISDDEKYRRGETIRQQIAMRCGDITRKCGPEV